MFVQWYLEAHDKMPQYDPLLASILDDCLLFNKKAEEPLLLLDYDAPVYLQSYTTQQTVT